MVRENAEKEKSKLLPREASKNSTPPQPAVFSKIYPEIEWPPEWSDSLPPPYPPVLQPVPQPSAPVAPPLVLGIGEGGTSAGTRSWRGAPSEGPADSTVGFHLELLEPLLPARMIYSFCNNGLFGPLISITGK